MTLSIEGAVFFWSQIGFWRQTLVYLRMRRRGLEFKLRFVHLLPMSHNVLPLLCRDDLSVTLLRRRSPSFPYVYLPKSKPHKLF